MDAEDAAILWWGYGANLVRADGTRGEWQPGDGRKEDTEGYQLRDLRYAIGHARKAMAARDTLVWGEDHTIGGSYQHQAEAVAEYFAHEPDDYFLPEVLVETGASGHTQLLYLEGPPGNRDGPEKIICADMDSFFARDNQASGAATMVL